MDCIIRITERPFRTTVAAAMIPSKVAAIPQNHTPNRPQHRYNSPYLFAEKVFLQLSNDLIKDIANPYVINLFLSPNLSVKPIFITPVNFIFNCFSKRF